MPYQPKRNLRSSDSATLTVPDVRSAVGRRAFAFAAPHYGTLFLSLCVLVQLSLLSVPCLKHIYFHHNFFSGYLAAFSDIWRCYVSDLSIDLLQMGWIGCASHLLHLMLGTSLTSSLDEELDVKCGLID